MVSMFLNNVLNHVLNQGKKQEFASVLPFRMLPFPRCTLTTTKITKGHVKACFQL